MNHNVYLFDTDVLLTNPNLIERFHTKLVMPCTIFDELAQKKNKSPNSEKVRLALNHIERYRILLAQAEDRTGGREKTMLYDALSKHDASEITVVSNTSTLRTRAISIGMKTQTEQGFIASQDQGDVDWTPARQHLYDLIVRGQFKQALDLQNNSKENLNPNFFLKNGHTPLIECIKKKQIKAVEFLLSHPDINPDMKDQAKLHMTPFTHAAQRKQLDIMEMLLAENADPYITSSGVNRGNSALLIAAWDGSLDIIEFLADHQDYTFSLNQADNNGYTPLIKASIKGHVDIVKYLLKRGVDVYIRDRDHKSALDHAEKHKNEAIAELISEAMA